MAKHGVKNAQWVAALSDRNPFEWMWILHKAAHNQGCVVLHVLGARALDTLGQFPRKPIVFAKQSRGDGPERTPCADRRAPLPIINDGVRADHRERQRPPPPATELLCNCCTRLLMLEGDSIDMREGCFFLCSSNSHANVFSQIGLGWSAPAATTHHLICSPTPWRIVLKERFHS